MSHREPARLETKLDGRSLYSQRQGVGPDVLLIAGLGADHRVWDPLAGLLAETHAVTTFDNRGVGLSPYGTGTVSIPSMAEDAVAVMDAHDIETATVVGSSMGGAIAQELVLGAPCRVNRLALIGTWAGPDLHLQRTLRHQCLLVELIDDPQQLFEALALWDYSGEAHAAGTVSRFASELEAGEPLIKDREAFRAAAGAAIEHDARSRLGAISVPTLVLYGSEDRITPPRLGEELARLIPGAESVCLHQRGHMPFHETPVSFLTELRRIL